MKRVRFIANIALLLALSIGAPLAACEALRALGANGERPTAPDLARIYSLALDLARQMPSYRDDQMHELLQAPLVPHPEFSSELKTLWRELVTAVERLDGASRDEALDLFRLSVRERLGLRFKSHEKREELRDAKRLFTPAVANWTDPIIGPSDYLDHATGIVHSLPFPRIEHHHWQVEKSGSAWLLANQRRTLDAFFWNPPLGSFVKLQTTPFLETTGLRRIFGEVTPSELSISVTPDGTRAAVTSKQLVKYPFRRSFYLSQTAVYDPASGKQLQVWKHPHPAQIKEAVISVDGKEVWLAQGSTVYRWNLETDRTDTFELGNGTPYDTVLGRPVDGVVPVMWSVVATKRIGALDVKTGELKHVFTSNDRYAKFSDDGRWFLERIEDANSAERLSTLRLHHLPSGKRLPIIADQAMDLRGSISSDGTQVWIFQDGSGRGRWGYALESLWDGSHSGIEIPK